MKYSFKKHNFTVVKKAISGELATFMYNYLLMKEQVLKYLKNNKYISPFEFIHGSFGDDQAPEPKAYVVYGDVGNETMLLRCQGILEKHTGLKLIPTYTYSRNYQKGNSLKRHKDRPSCAISCTLSYGGDSWPIYLEPSGETGKKGVKVVLEPGDLLIYKGCELEHWREPLKGETCVQAFLHYNEASDITNLYDKRPHLGLPAWFKNG